MKRRYSDAFVESEFKKIENNNTQKDKRQREADECIDQEIKRQREADKCTAQESRTREARSSSSGNGQ